MDFVQKIEFVLSHKQIMRMIKMAETQGIRITLGITETAEIVMLCDGVLRDLASSEIQSTSNSEKPCPVPPGCPTSAACVAKFTALLPRGVNSGTLLNYDNISNLFPDL